MQAELESGAPIESFNDELERMLEMTGADYAARARREESKQEDDDDVFYECVTTSEGLGGALSAAGKEYQLIMPSGPFAETATVDAERQEEIIDLACNLT